MKKVMLIGDSIRLSYMPEVKKLLEGKAEVWGPEENCRFAKYTIWGIKAWLIECGKPDIIHWNNGLWDTHVFEEEMAAFSSVDEYISDMKRIYRLLKMTGATIIFATTTPVKNANLTQANDRIDEYNAAILEFITKQDVIINDLSSLIKQDIDCYIADDLLHLSQEGIEVASKQVAEVIERYL